MQEVEHAQALVVVEHVLADGVGEAVQVGVELAHEVEVQVEGVDWERL